MKMKLKKLSEEDSKQIQELFFEIMSCISKFMLGKEKSFNDAFFVCNVSLALSVRAVGKICEVDQIENYFNYMHNLILQMDSTCSELEKDFPQDMKTH